MATIKLKPIAEQVVAVVGASSGIGRETALRFAARGAQVVVAARSEPGLISLVEEIQAAGGRATAVVADVADFGQTQTIAERAVAEYGGLDTWVHLAAVLVHGTFEQTTVEEFRRIVDVNLLGQIHGAKAALPYLRHRGAGALIHVSSVEAVRALPYHSAYAASKHGIAGFVEALRVELAHEGVPISVTQVLPGTINTPLFNKARSKIGVKPQGMPPFYQPGVVADSILYAAEHPVRDILAGDAAAAIALNQRFAPRLLDAFLARFGFPLQETEEPTAIDAPDNLFGPMPGQDRSEGDFGHGAIRRSPLTWLETHPAAAAVGAATGAAGLLALRAGKIARSGRRKRVASRTLARRRP